MTKRILPLALALCLAFSLASCGEKAQPSSQAPVQPSSIEVRSSQSEEPAPDGDEPSDLDALVREIVLTYGAKEDTLNGPVRLVPTDISLFIGDISWAGEESLSPGDYFAWFFSTTMKEDYEYKREAYKHPKGDDYGWFFPQELYEERVQAYFEVSVDHLRSDPAYYQAEYQGYCLGSGGGKGESPTLTYEYSREGELLTIAVDRVYPSGAFPTSVTPSRSGWRTAEGGSIWGTGWSRGLMLQNTPLGCICRVAGYRASRLLLSFSIAKRK